ncbi:MAG: hypothetical protein K2X11_10470, partial [Acetobacteraceae bacterium]|nr:hypothetical protein [Acetobacteraceae bacterium]
MNHPLTFVTFVAFFCAGFYVFQTKEEVAKLDRELRDVKRQTETERGRTQILAAEWARLNDQERLRTMAAAHLRHLEPMQPAQFQRMDDAQRRLPQAVAFQGSGAGFQPRTDVASAPGGVLVVTAASLLAEDRQPQAQMAAVEPARPAAQEAA